MILTDSPIGKAMNLVPHPGFVPFRIARRMMAIVRGRIINTKTNIPRSIAEGLVR